MCGLGFFRFVHVQMEISGQRTTGRCTDLAFRAPRKLESSFQPSARWWWTDRSGLRSSRSWGAAARTMVVPTSQNRDVGHPKFGLDRHKLDWSDDFWRLRRWLLCRPALAGQTKTRRGRGTRNVDWIAAQGQVQQPGKTPPHGRRPAPSPQTSRYRSPGTPSPHPSEQRPLTGDPEPSPQ
jgi:hypothetical protein